MKIIHSMSWPWPRGSSMADDRGRGSPPGTGAGTQKPTLKGIMLSRQKDLPKLPVPPLKATMDKLLLSLAPIVPPEEMRYTVQLITKFSESGEGEYLLKLLTHRAKHTDNWLDEWWMTSAYLDVRTPLPAYLSPVGLFPRQTFHSEEEFLRYAAKLVAALLEFKDLIDRQALPPDTAGHMALDMTMYFRMFAVHRVARPHRDELFFYADGPDPPSHIVVMHNNRAIISNTLSSVTQLFQVNVYNKHGGRPFKERELYPQLVEVMEQSRSVGHPLGFLTSNDRDSWAQAYERLAIGNEDRLERVQRSILILCLDEPMTPMKPWEIHNPLYMLVGGQNAEYGGNRWYDKTLQFVVGAEGNVGIILEHSPCDGTVVVPLLDHTFTYM
ncbi:unnamed protein product, partial [Ixodes persulcatus]